MAINFPEKYKAGLVEGFNQAAETNDLFTTELDTEFTGVRTVHVAQVRPVPLNNYNRNKQFGTGSRYGDSVEAQDDVLTLEMVDDVSFSETIDKGNRTEQLSWKETSGVMKVQKEKVIAPYLDKYRLDKWGKGAGIKIELSKDLTKTNIVSDIIDAHSEQGEHGVPDRVNLVIARNKFKELKKSTEWMGNDDLGKVTLPKGTLGEFDGMPTKRITSKKMPEHVPFMLIDKDSVISPMKINDMNLHRDPPGMSGDLLEFRMTQDAFVLPYKTEGVLIAVEKGFLTHDCTFEDSVGSITITSDNGETVHYTTDGSDPRFSKTAKTGTSCSLEVGETVKAYATAANKYDSNVTEYTRKE